MSDRDRENLAAIGGMRNPHLSITRVPKAKLVGPIIADILKSASSHPSVVNLVRNLLGGKPATPVSTALVEKLRALVINILDPGLEGLPAKTCKAQSPLSAEILWAWGTASFDPDSRTLATWIRTGAPLGFEESIPSTGIYPTISDNSAEKESILSRSLEGWLNYPSAVEEHDELCKLVADAHQKGFCTFYSSVEEAEKEIGAKPVLNKLGVIVKVKETGKKARIIWDLRESGVNKICNPSERIILPRLIDAAQDILTVFRHNGVPRLLAIDVQDAFHNIPAGRDRAYTMAAFQDGDSTRLLCYDVLVFGSASSPTLWGRYAAFMGRSLAAIIPQIRVQTYVDDPIITFDSLGPDYLSHLGVALLWLGVAGFPIKLSKADAGSSVKWIGATLQVNDFDKSVTVSLPEDKRQETIARCQSFLSKPVIGTRQLRSLAGSLSFIAGIIPPMRPFLSALWAVLGSANDGSKISGKLIHTKRIAPALEWILSVLVNFAQRTLWAHRPESHAVIVTDASTHGLGAVKYVRGEPKEYFSCPIPSVFIHKFNAQTGDPQYMCLWESLCLLIAARLWLEELPLGTVVRVRADNIAALHMLRKGSAKSTNLNVVAREIAYDMALGRYEWTLLAHIHTKLNTVADALSRLHDPEPPTLPVDDLQGAKRIPIEVDDSFWRVIGYVDPGRQGVKIRQQSLTS